MSVLVFERAADADRDSDDFSFVFETHQTEREVLGVQTTENLTLYLYEVEVAWNRLINIQFSQPKPAE